MTSLTESVVDSTITPAFSTRTFRDAMGLFATGIVVVTAGDEATPHGMTANAFMSVSLEPPLVLVSIRKQAHMHDYLIEQGRFGISILSEEQQDASQHFAGQKGHVYKPVFEWLAGLPVLADARLQLATSLHKQVDCGDHTLFVGEVQAFEQPGQSTQPLLYHQGRYAAIAHRTGPLA